MTCSCAIVACLGKKLLVGCTGYLGIEDVYMEVVGKEMTCIPMSRDLLPLEQPVGFPLKRKG